MLLALTPTLVILVIMDLIYMKDIVLTLAQKNTMPLYLIVPHVILNVKLVMNH